MSLADVDGRKRLNSGQYLFCLLYDDVCHHDFERTVKYLFLFCHHYFEHLQPRPCRWFFSSHVFFQLIIWPYGASCLSGMVSAVRQIRDARAIRCPFGKYSVPFQSHHSFKNLILVWVNRVTGASFYFYTHTNSSSRELKANAKKIANQYI